MNIMCKKFPIIYEKNRCNIFAVSCFAMIEFVCHIDATEQKRALNFEFVVSDQLFSVILVTYNYFKIQRL